MSVVRAFTEDWTTFVASRGGLMTSSPTPLLVETRILMKQQENVFSYDLPESVNVTIDGQHAAVVAGGVKTAEKVLPGGED